VADVPGQLVTALQDRYRLERELGAGGMATVYLAEDLKHGRRVAVKVLRPELAAVLGSERFLAEIKTTAHLQHPHILQLFDSGSAGGLLYYVMPFIDGESLRGRLNREKQLPVDEAVAITRAAAAALDYAHRHGVIHRDIKPENILLLDGQPLVADFGIALAVTAAGGVRLTQTGLSLGTPQYMSPEQATGERELDVRSDIYALGAVTYEMLSGEPPFTGSTTQVIIAKLMTEEPCALSVLRRAVPDHVEAAVHRALQKLPADRFATAAQFAEALSKPGSITLPATRAARGTSAGQRASRGVRVMGAVRAGAPWALALGVLVVGGLLAREKGKPEPTSPPVARFALKLAPRVTTILFGQVLAFSPDGSRLVFVGDSGSGDQLYSRSLDQIEPIPIPGSAEAESPFFSPDGRVVGFFASGQLVKIALAGGPAQPICDVQGAFRGGTWNLADTIVFADDRGLMRVPAAGGHPEPLAAPEPGTGETYRWPDFLPDGKTVLFAIDKSSLDRLAAATLATRSVKRFDVLGGNPHYVRQGYVALTVIDSTVLGAGNVVAVPFDVGRLKALGASVLIAQGVGVGTGSRTGKMGMSRDGSMAYITGKVGRTLVLVGRNGSMRDLGSASLPIREPRLSPDGRRIALLISERSDDIWIFNLALHTMTRLTVDRSAQHPVWTPDGRRVVYQRRGDHGLDLWWIPSDGSGPAESLLVAPGDQLPGAFTPDGRTFVYGEVGDSGRLKRRISYLQLDGSRTPQSFLSNGFNNRSPSLSPDGHWMAYVSDESGHVEVYVRPFPGPGGRWQISNGGGTEPRWSPTGRELFFWNGPMMMAASVPSGASFVSGEVRELFRWGYKDPDINYSTYDITRDGQSFVTFREYQTGDQTVMVVLNLFAHLAASGRESGVAR
jgi:eukaryotic-like serine/threonine-protein kinase